MEGKKFKFGVSLRESLEAMLKKVLSRNIDAFTWLAANMLGIDPDFYVTT